MLSTGPVPLEPCSFKSFAVTVLDAHRRHCLQVGLDLGYRAQCSLAPKPCPCSGSAPAPMCVRISNVCRAPGSCNTSLGLYRYRGDGTPDSKTARCAEAHTVCSRTHSDHCLMQRKSSQPAGAEARNPRRRTPRWSSWDGARSCRGQSSSGL